MKKFEEWSLKQQADAGAYLNLSKVIIGIIILTIGFTDLFIEDKGSFWSILYIIVGFILIFRYNFNYKTHLENKKLERELN
jgi:TM2 domain-containing membrane protein YozV